MIIEDEAESLDYFIKKFKASIITKSITTNNSNPAPSPSTPKTENTKQNNIPPEVKSFMPNHSKLKWSDCWDGKMDAEEAAYNHYLITKNKQSCIDLLIIKGKETFKYVPEDIIRKRAKDIIVNLFGKIKKGTYKQKSELENNQAPIQEVASIEKEKTKQNKEHEEDDEDEEEEHQSDLAGDID